MVGGIISGLGSLIGAGTGIYNAIQNDKVAKENLALQKEHFQYQKDLQKQIFEREDTAVQRRVKDLEASGFSKWLATGQSAGAGSVVGTSAPQKQRQNLDMSQAIQGIYSLGEMMYNMRQQEANIGLSNAQAGLLQSQVLTEAQKRINMIAESELTEAQKDKLLNENQELLYDLHFYHNRLNRPRDYNAGPLSVGGSTSFQLGPFSFSKSANVSGNIQTILDGFNSGKYSATEAWKKVQELFKK